MEKEKDQEGTTKASDNVDTNAHYNKEGEPVREDKRDEKDSLNNWNSEKNRSGRHK